MLERMEKTFLDMRDAICKVLEKLDGQRFCEDRWRHPDSGGGVSRVMQNGSIFEKAGVNVSMVSGALSQEAHAANF